jgi:RNA polymerase sigma-70 factor (ECF subfamily)
MDVEDFVLEDIDIEDRHHALDRIMDHYGQDILQLVYSYVQNQTVAEDLTQEIFVKCYKSLHTYKMNAKVRTWLWRIAINHCKDYLRSWYYRNVHTENKRIITIQDNQSSIEKKIMRKDEDRALGEAVLNLPTQYKEVIYLYYFEERAIKEIHELTDVNESTVKTRLRRGKELLKEQLEEVNHG